MACVVGMACTAFAGPRGLFLASYEVRVDTQHQLLRLQTYAWPHHAICMALRVGTTTCLRGPAGANTQAFAGCRCERGDACSSRRCSFSTTVVPPSSAARHRAGQHTLWSTPPLSTPPPPRSGAVPSPTAISTSQVTRPLKWRCLLLEHAAHRAECCCCATTSSRRSISDCRGHAAAVEPGSRSCSGPAWRSSERG